MKNNIKYEIGNLDKHQKFIYNIVKLINTDVENWKADMLSVTKEYIENKLKTSLSVIAISENNEFVWFWAVENVIWDYYEIRSLYVKEDFRKQWIWWILLEKRMEIIQNLWKIAVMFANDLWEHWAKNQWMENVCKTQMPKEFFDDCVGCNELDIFPNCHCKVYKKVYKKITQINNK